MLRCILFVVIIMWNDASLVEVLKYQENAAASRVAAPDQSVQIACAVISKSETWKRSNSGPVLIVDIEIAKSDRTIRIIPAVHLTPKSRMTATLPDGYWAAFDLGSGRPRKGWQAFDLEKDGRRFQIIVNPTELLWAPEKSSVWPSRKLKSLAAPGEYSTWLTIELEGKDTVSSKAITIRLE